MEISFFHISNKKKHRKKIPRKKICGKLGKTVADI
jgi:hypothetical protein